jgi:hypothetical protein
MAAGNPIPAMSQIAISSAPVLISAANINRKRLSVVALTPAVDIYIGASSTMSSTNGFPVLARAAPFEIGSVLTTGAIYGCSTAAGTLGVLGY